MADNVESAYESLAKLDKALVSSAKNAATLSRGISKVYKLQAGKNWEIFSRFISGSGLWKVQNKMRAIVQVMHQFTDAGNKAAEASAKQLTQLTELQDAHSTLTKAKDLYSNGLDKAHGKALLKQEEYLQLAQKLTAQNKSGAEIEEAIQQRYMENQSSKYKSLTQLVGAEKAKAQMLKEIDREVANSKEVLDKAEESMRKALDKEEKLALKKGLQETYKAKSRADKKILVADYKNKKRRYKADRKAFSELQKEKGRIEASGRTLTIKQQEKFDKAKSRMDTSKDRIKASADKIPALAGQQEMFEKVGGIFDIFKQTTKGQKKRQKLSDWFSKQTSKMGMFLKSGVMFLGYALLGILGLFLVIGIAKKAWKYISSAFEDYKVLFEGIFGFIYEGGMLVWNGIMGIWDFFVNGEGTWMGFISDLVDIVWGLLMIGLGLLGTIFLGLMTLVWAAVKATWAWLKADFIGRLPKLILGVLLIWLAFWAVSQIMILTGLPILFAVAIAVVIGAIVWKVAKWIGGLFSWKASGGPASGATIVGEKGPELLNLPNGSRVTSNADSRKLASGGGNVINVHVNGRVGASDKEIRDIASKVAKLINVEINRNSNVM